MSKKELFIRRIHGGDLASFDGNKNREIKQRRGRAAKAKHLIEEEISSYGGEVFNYKLLGGEWKELVDWLFDTNFYPGKEHGGIEVDEVCSSLARGYCPNGMDTRQLVDWVRDLRDKTKIN